MSGKKTEEQSKSGSNDLNTWYEEVRTTQQCMWAFFGDRVWDKIKRDMVKVKVEFALYGSVSDDDKDKKDKLKIIQDLTDVIVNLNPSKDEVLFSFILVCIKKCSDGAVSGVPIFKTCDGGNTIFIEPCTLRIYRSWKDYLINNRLPACYMCYPQDGVYKLVNDKLLLVHSKSVACNKLPKIVDNSASIGNIVASGVCVSAVFCPVLMPVVLPAVTAVAFTGGFVAVRNAGKLVDIHKHGGSLKDKEACKHWINLATTTVSSVAVGGAAMLTKRIAGRTIGRFATLGMETLNYASVTVNTIGFVNYLAEFIMKFKEGTLEMKDINLVMSMCLCIANIAISVKMTQLLISDLTKVELGNGRQLFHMAKNTRFSEVKTVTVYEDTPTSLLTLKNIIFGRSWVGYVCQNLGVPYIKIFAEKLIECCQDYKSGKICPEQFLMNVFQLVLNYWPQIQKELMPVINWFSSKFQNLPWRKIKINGKFIFEVSSPRILSRVKSSIENVHGDIPQCDEKTKRTIEKSLVNLVKIVCKEINCQNDSQFVSVVACLCAELRKELKNRLTSNRENLNNEKPNMALKDIIVNYSFDDEVLQNFVRKYLSENSVDEINTDRRIYEPIFIDEDVKFYYFDAHQQRMTKEYLCGKVSEILQIPIDQIYAGSVVSHENMTTIETENKMVVFHYTTNADITTGFAVVTKLSMT